jgi:hypothetical protein
MISLLAGPVMFMVLCQAPAAKTEKIYDVKEWGVEGRGWQEAERTRYFDRFPAKAEKMVPKAVWDLSRDSAGMMARFSTDAKTIKVKYKLMSAALSMPHMPATGKSGLDLYARDDAGKWRWLAVTMPTAQMVEADLPGSPQGVREFALYLPLYNGVETLQVTLPASAQFTPLPPRKEKALLFYGTSITHGACASRPGMVHTAILGRRLDMPVINLGFSGNGRMDPGVGEWLAKEDPAAYVIDCLPNMGPKDVTERTVPLVKALRKAHPDTPIILVEDRVFTNAWANPAKKKFHEQNHAALKKEFEKLKADGVSKLFYIAGDRLLGDDSEGATDASHPNDLGFMRQADAFEPVIREALNKPAKAR